MAINTLMYFILALCGLIGGTIAWDDLRSHKSDQKRDPEPEIK